MNIIERPVKNQSARPPGTVVDSIIVHDTGSLSAHGTFEWFDNPASQASAHYLVDRDGTTYRLVPDDRKAWHAGQSSLWGRGDLNLTSVGIELVDVTADPYPMAQYEALIALTVDLCLRHRAVTLNRIVGHEHVAPGRKVDPGVDFPWRNYLIVVGAQLATRAGGLI